MVSKSAIRILVLDDDSFTLKLLARMLENLGYAEVSIRDSGRAALELVDSPDACPDLILMDLNMPEMDGVEFVRHLAEHRYTGSLILLSGEDEQMLLAAEKLVQAHKIPALGHLRKPVKPEDLAVLIEKWTPPSQGEPQAAKKIYGADEVHAAIANGELVNYYQPKISPANGRVAGVETLVRWHHPEDGIVLPGQFIGVAETHGLIGDLTRVVLVSAFAQAKAWQDEGLAQQISINVSLNSLAPLDFADFVAKLAANAGVPPQMVVLEIPGNRLMQEDMRFLLENMTRLRLKRFRLSIGGFGAWNASPSQLLNIPFDELKIDRHCVHCSWADEKLRAKYDDCLAMARKLAKEAVAEGVEDLNDFNHVRRTGCEFAQGHFIARPMPAVDMPAWKADWQKRWSSGFGGDAPASA